MNRPYVTFHRTHLFLGLCCILLAPHLSASHRTPCFPLKKEVLVQLQRGQVWIRLEHQKDKNYHIRALIWIPCRRRTIWNVLTDYNHLADFLPQMKACALIQDSAGVKRVAQIGKSRFLLFSKTVRVVLNVREQATDSISFWQVSGDFKTFRGQWQLFAWPDSSAALVCYRAVIQPNFFAPSFITKAIQKRDISRMLKAVRTRCRILEGKSATKGRKSAGLPK